MPSPLVAPEPSRVSARPLGATALLRRGDLSVTEVCASRSAARRWAPSAVASPPVRDVGGGRLVATVTDPDGNVLGLLQDR
jgi:hypothetical protein